MAQSIQTVSYTKDNPFIASLKENRLLSRHGSQKETRHFVIDISGSGMHYTVGDSLGVFPQNDGAAVDEVLRLLGFSGEETVEVPKVERAMPVREAFLTRLSLASPTRKALEAFRDRATNAGDRAALEALLLPGARDQLMEFLSAREFVDLLEEFRSVRFTPEEFVLLPRRLMPRLYSIASSRLVYPDEVHLTVAVVRYQTNERDRIGVCSTYLSDRLPLNRSIVPVFVASSHFGLPEDDSRDIIMVGPGTGVAPFRAFIQERAARNAPGRSWLFFGDQHRESDFLYEEELEEHLTSRDLSRLDLAFSRDQAQKVYVQHRMREKGAELWEWIENGAYFYVCGDARRMAKDVDSALHEIVSREGDMPDAEAAEYIKIMRREKRYQRDVY